MRDKNLPVLFLNLLRGIKWNGTCFYDAKRCLCQRFVRKFHKICEDNSLIIFFTDRDEKFAERRKWLFEAFRTIRPYSYSDSDISKNLKVI